MRKELRDKIVAFNQEYRRINAELNKYGMRLVLNAIFKGRPPYSEYMGSKTDWEQIIQNEIKNN